MSRFTVAIVMVVRGVDGNDHCSWCRYLSCVPTSKWSCKSSPGTCKVRRLSYKYWPKYSTLTIHLPFQINQRDTLVTLTCQETGKSRNYTLPTTTENLLYDLCVDLCRWGALTSTDTQLFSLFFPFLGGKHPGKFDFFPRSLPFVFLLYAQYPKTGLLSRLLKNLKPKKKNWNHDKRRGNITNSIKRRAHIKCIGNFFIMARSPQRSRSAMHRRKSEARQTLELGGTSFAQSHSERTPISWDRPPLHPLSL